MESERFWVECPGCGDEKGSYSTEMIRAGRSCDCGTDFTISPETRDVEVIKPVNPQKKWDR